MSEAEQTDRGTGRRLDFVMGAAMAALSLLLFFWFIPTFAPGEGGPGQIAPSFFPRFSVVVVFICAILIMATSARAAMAADGNGPRLLAEVAGWSAFACVLFALLQWAGFVPAGIFAVLSGVILTRYRGNLILVGLLAVGLPILLDQGVWMLFQIELP